MSISQLKKYKLSDTIAAIATYPASSALGVIKISGKRAIPIAARIFIPKKREDIRKAKTYSLHYGWIMERSEKKRKASQLIDEVLVSIMRKPHSYTREDVVEISSHGGVAVLNTVLGCVLREGARLAFPGEFTYRAFVRGRIGLFEAESILGMVGAPSQEGVKAAAQQLRGAVGEQFSVLRENIKELFVETESALNFPEEDVPFSLSLFKKKLISVERKVDELLRASFRGRILKEGIKCVICGKTNTGKSTLFNQFLRQERVIVSPLAGTTRDVIEETIVVKGIPLRMYDTAGVLEPTDLITRKAVEGSCKVFAETDLAILLLDGSRPLDEEDMFLLKKVKEKNAIVAINKIDLKQRLQSKKLSGYNGCIIKMSALKNKGIDELEDALFRKIHQGGLKEGQAVFLYQRQRSALEKIKEHLRQARHFIDEKYTVDFINASLRACLDEFDFLTGDVMPQEILEDIFSRFCIGK